MGKRERRKDARKKQIVQIAMGVVLVLLMVMSVVQYASTGNTNELRFEGQRFRVDSEQGAFTTKISGTEIMLHSAPLEGNASQATFQSIYGPTVIVHSSQDVAQLLRQSNLLSITFDPTTPSPDIQAVEVARFELSRNYPGTVGGGVLTNSSLYNLPVVTCNPDSQYPVLAIIADNTSTNINITREGNCITMTGEASTLPIGKDFILLTAAGVIPDA